VIWLALFLLPIPLGMVAARLYRIRAEPLAVRQRLALLYLFDSGLLIGIWAGIVLNATPLLMLLPIAGLLDFLPAMRRLREVDGQARRRTEPKYRNDHPLVLER
jgi:hypothetical protein